MGRKQVSIYERISALEHGRASIRDVASTESYLKGVISQANLRGDEDEEYAALQVLLSAYTTWHMKRRVLATSSRILELGARTVQLAYANASALFRQYRATRHAIAHLRQGAGLVNEEPCSPTKMKHELLLSSLDLEILVLTHPRSKRLSAVLRYVWERMGNNLGAIDIASFAEDLVGAQALQSSRDQILVVQLLQRAWGELSRQARFQGRQCSAELDRLEVLISHAGPPGMSGN